MTCGQDLGPCSTSFNAGRQEHIQPARGTLLLLHSPGGQSETPEKLCKCKITNPLRIGRGQGKKEQSVRRQEPAAGGVAAVGVCHLHSHHYPGLEPRLAKSQGLHKGGGAEVSPGCSRPSSWSIGHSSVLTFLIRLAGRNKSGCSLWIKWFSRVQTY